MEKVQLSTLRNDKAKLKRIASLMKTIGHPARLSIIDLLLEKGKLPVKEIHEAIDIIHEARDISNSNASQHLTALELLDE